MALVFLATQGVSRHNEVVLSRHRSRLRNRNKSKSNSNINTNGKEVAPLSRRALLKPGCRPPITLDDEPYGEEEERFGGRGDITLYPCDPKPFGEDDNEKGGDGHDDDNDEDDVDELSDLRVVSDDDEDEEEEEEKGDDEILNRENKLRNNNNNDINYNFNKLNKPTHCIGCPVEAFPPSLIKWPLNNGVRSKRLSDIRKQVKRLSTAIKMTIDSDGENSPDGKRTMNPAPFSSLVDMSLLRTDPPSSVSQLPSVDELDALLTASKTKESKAMVRESDWGVEHMVRKDLWKRLTKNISREEFSDYYYWDTVQQMYGSKEMSKCDVVLPTFVDRKLISTFALSTEGIKACERVISVIAYSSPAITYAPLVYPLTALLMHYMEEPDTYNCISLLLSKSSTYISQTKILHESMWRTVEILARKHMRGSYSMLNKFGITPQQINEGFQNWTSWMFSQLPFNHLIRIVDCFLLEGSKVLLRASLAIFHLFMKQVSRDSNIAAMLTTKGLAESVSVYTRNIQATPAKLLKTAFGIRALSKSEIKKIVTQTEMAVKSDPCMGGSSGLGSLMRSSSLENLPTSESQENIQAMSHTMDIKELLTIWSWIPMRMTMNHPKLIYTTQEHGSSLTNFYLRVNKSEPTLLLVRTTNDEVFGAYCSSPWNQRTQRDEFGHKQTYFGTGETFLFTLKPEVTRYEWVGITQQRENVGLTSVAHQSELFMHADNDMITVGGGNGHGLMLDHELQFGKTERCETFNNPPLCSTPDFEIKVVEVFSLGEDA